jgi:hypothetical protein
VSLADHITHLHVMPVGDLVEHVASEDCICGPRTRPVFRDDGSNGWISMHCSLDRRDLTEVQP